MPPLPGGGGGGGFNGSLGTSSATLSIIYQGEKVPITKDRFVIGRGKQSSDLTLKDPNVSRQHAMIEYQNGVYFMVDMGSTNGVEYNGQRIARKQIAEGDIDRIVSESEVPVIIDFHADWCGPCKAMAPMFDELARERRGQALILKLDTDRNPNATRRFGVRGIPTMILFRDGKEVAREVGAVPRDRLRGLLDRA